MSSNVSILNVHLHGEIIATITNVGHDRMIFAFTKAYANNELRPTLSLNFKDALGNLITYFKPTQTKLIPYFSNLLPEGAMRNYLADRAGVSSVREFFYCGLWGKIYLALLLYHQQMMKHFLLVFISIKKATSVKMIRCDFH